MSSRTAVLIAALACCVAAQDLPTAPAPKPRVLLAWEETAFKKALVEEMKTLLETSGHVVTVVQHEADWVSKVGIAGYDVVFITNSGVKSKVRPWVVEWLSKHAAHASKVLLHTTKTKVWKEAVSVDAVSSASDVGAAKELAAQYVARVTAKATSAAAADSTDGN